MPVKTWLAVLLVGCGGGSGSALVEDTFAVPHDVADPTVADAGQDAPVVSPDAPVGVDAPSQGEDAPTGNVDAAEHADAGIEGGVEAGPPGTDACVPTSYLVACAAYPCQATGVPDGCGSTYDCGIANPSLCQGDAGTPPPFVCGPTVQCPPEPPGLTTTCVAGVCVVCGPPPLGCSPDNGT